MSLGELDLEGEAEVRLAQAMAAPALRAGLQLN